MPTGQGRFTGLLGYDRNYEYLGDSNLPFRIVEKYSYTVYDHVLSNREDLPGFFKSQFASLLGVFQNDINVTSLSCPVTNDHLSSDVEFKKHIISFEVRSSGEFASTVRDGYTGTRNAGMSGILPYHRILKNFKDSFSLSNSETSTKNYSHDISFSLMTGTGLQSFSSLKDIAQTIAQSLFNGEPDSLSSSAFPHYGDFNDSNSKQYFSETFDALNFSFAFSKKRSIEPFNSGNYSHSTSHSISLGENGVFDISEKIKVVGKSSFSQASQGFVDLSAGAYTRCQNLINSYSGVFSGPPYFWSSFGNSLQNLSTSETRNIPGLTVNGTFSYSNDPTKLNGLSKNEEFDINRSSEGVITVNHVIKYSLDSFISSNTDDLAVSGASSIIDIIQSDRSSSPAQVGAIYSSLSNMTGAGNGLFRTKTSVSAPQRAKAYSATFNYSDDPSFNTSRFIDPFSSSAVTGFIKLSVDSQNTEPKDLISEFKIINRPSQTSILHYGYQQEPATFSVSFNGKIPRRGNSLYPSSRYIPSGESFGLLNYAEGLFLNKALNNSDVFNYYLRGLKFGCDSNNSFDMSVQFEYTKKRT